MIDATDLFSLMIEVRSFELRQVEVEPLSRPLSSIATASKSDKDVRELLVSNRYKAFQFHQVVSDETGMIEASGENLCY